MQLQYHFICELVAMGETAVAYITMDENEVDVLTKVLPSGAKRWKFIGELLWDLKDEKNGRMVPVTPGTGTQGPCQANQAG